MALSATELAAVPAAVLGLLLLLTAAGDDGATALMEARSDDIDGDGNGDEDEDDGDGDDNDNDGGDEATLSCATTTSSNSGVTISAFMRVIVRAMSIAASSCFALAFEKHMGGLMRRTFWSGPSKDVRIPFSLIVLTACLHAAESGVLVPGLTNSIPMNSPLPLTFTCGRKVNVRARGIGVSVPEMREKERKTLGQRSAPMLAPPLFTARSYSARSANVDHFQSCASEALAPHLAISDKPI